MAIQLLFSFLLHSSFLLYVYFDKIVFVFFCCALLVQFLHYTGFQLLSPNPHLPLPLSLFSTFLLVVATSGCANVVLICKSVNDVVGGYGI